MLLPHQMEAFPKQIWSYYLATTVNCNLYCLKVWSVDKLAILVYLLPKVHMLVCWGHCCQQYCTKHTIIGIVIHVQHRHTHKNACETCLAYQHA